MPPRSKKHKLTPKEDAVIAETVRAVNAGEKFSLAKSVEKIYNVKKTSAATIASQKAGQHDFRATLLAALENRKIIGADSRVEQVLDEGLDAVTEKDNPDFRVRLDYVKEINKIAGVLAPLKSETKSMRLNMDMSEEELNKKIKALKEELEK